MIRRGRIAPRSDNCPQYSGAGMRSAKSITCLMAFLVAVPVVRGADTKPAEELARLKKQLEKAYMEASEEGRETATAEAERKASDDRFSKEAVALGRRALVLAETHPDSPEALEALIWAENIVGFSIEAVRVRDSAYELIARRYLGSDAILLTVKSAWSRAVMSAQGEMLLRAAVERSPNAKVRGQACSSLAQYHQRLLALVRDLDSPYRGRSIRELIGPERVRQLRELRPEDLRREAETLYEQVIREYGDLRPIETFPPLGEQARGDLYKLRHLEPGCTVPEIEGKDLDGRPMRLSDFRGKVILISFWATWCAPCMSMVPAEKALLERMRGRPFVIVGVNGDEDASRAKEVVARKGINWRSFWEEGGPKGGTALRWGASVWPTIYLIDAKGVIRESSEGLRGADLDQAAASLVAEAEAVAERTTSPSSAVR